MDRVGHRRGALAIRRMRDIERSARGPACLVVRTPRLFLAPLPVLRDRAWAGTWPDRRLVGLAGNRGGICDGQGEPTEFAPRRDTNVPGELRLVAGAHTANPEALGAIRPLPVALDIPFCACEAIVDNTSSRGSSALAGHGGVLDRGGLVRWKSSHADSEGGTAVGLGDGSSDEK